MRVESLREQVLEANLELVRRGLVLYTFGNASGISRQEGLIATKYSRMCCGPRRSGERWKCWANRSMKRM